MVAIMKMQPSSPLSGRCMPIWWALCKTGPTGFLRTTESSSFHEENVKSEQCMWMADFNSHSDPPLHCWVHSAIVGAALRSPGRDLHIVPEFLWYKN